MKGRALLSVVEAEEVCVRDASPSPPRDRVCVGANDPEGWSSVSVCVRVGSASREGVGEREAVWLSEADCVPDAETDTELVSAGSALRVRASVAESLATML